MAEKQLARELRLLGLTRAEAAKTLNITEATLSYWINKKFPISPFGVRKLQEMGISFQAVKNPSKEVED